LSSPSGLVGGGVLGGFLGGFLPESPELSVLESELEDFSLMPELDNDIDNNNAKLAYEYIQDCLETDKKGIESLERKLTTLLASSGVLLRLSMDLPDSSLRLTALKIGVNLCIATSLVLCLVGLKPKIVGGRVKAEELIDDEHYGMTDEEMRLFVGRQRIEASKEINEKFSQMQTLLFLSYTVIAIAGILFATSNIWYTLTRP
jgi:hypothetical protein